jgi:hypothetical protein
MHHSLNHLFLQIKLMNSPLDLGVGIGSVQFDKAIFSRFSKIVG